MCPSYLATRDEKDSTRGRARVLQEMLNGTLLTDGWKSAEIAESLDLCLSCKACGSDCPAGVDMASYKSEWLYEKYRHRPRPITHYALGCAAPVAAAAGRAPRLVNAAAGMGPARRLLMRAGGIDPRRAVPRLAPQTFRRWWQRPTRDAARQRGPHPAREIVLWIGQFHQRLRPADRAGRGDGAGALRLPGAAHRPAGVLRDHLDQHRPTRRRPPPAAAHAGPTGTAPAAGQADRRPGTVVHGGAALRPGRAAAGRPEVAGGWRRRL